MSYFFYLLIFGLFYFISNFQIHFALPSENFSSVSVFKSTSDGDKIYPVYGRKGGYRPKKQSLGKYAVYIRPRLYYSELNDKYFGAIHGCGGAILSEKLILTSAHCLVRYGHKFHPALLEVVASTPIRLKRTKYTQIIRVSKVIVHTNYNEDRIRFDIGMLQLKTKIHFDDRYAQAIPLPRAPPAEGAVCTTPGWGRFYWDGPYANEIIYVDLMVRNSSYCNRMLSRLVDGEICASDPIADDKNSCYGYSGGPFICNGTITGVVSYGYGCGLGTPGLYTDVYKYLDWISKSKCGKSRTSLAFLWFLSLMWIIIFK